MARLVGLLDVKADLNIRGNGDDDELQGFLFDTIDAVEQIVGPLSAQSRTDVVQAHQGVIVLPKTPVLAVQSVSLNNYYGATSVDDASAWTLDADAGILRRQLAVAPFIGVPSSVTVSYTVGRTDIPGSINRAILTQLRTMWRSQRGAQPAPASTDDAAPTDGMYGFIHPAVMELLRPFRLPPGVA